jgi:Domain of unknown function (DUF1707)
MAEPPKLRVSDEERERAAREIREHFAAGRLTEDELDERVQAAYQARTVQELRAIRADLPALPVTRAQQKAELAERRAQLRRRVLQESGGGLGAFVICTSIWAASGASGQFWPIWVLLVTVIALARNVWRLYGPAPEFDEIERELEARRHKNEARNQIRSEARSRAGRQSDRHRRERF